MNRLLYLLLLGTLAAPATAQQDIEYPRTVIAEGNTLKVHAPVIDRWDHWKRVEGWVPVEVRLRDSDRIWVGAVRASADTSINLERRLVTLSGQQVLNIRFTDEAVPERVRALAGQAVREQPQTVTLDELLNVLAPDFDVPRQARNPAHLGFEPPRIVVTDRPMRLLLVDKQPVLAPITGTALEFVVNTDWPLFHYPPTGRWYVLNQGVWQVSTLLSSGGWTTTDELPEDFRTLAISDDWPMLHETVPPRLPEVDPAPFLISLEPTELIVTRGPPVLQASGGAGLKYVVNTDRDLFQLDGRWYFLTAGRWFDTRDLEGRWQHTEPLPEAFSAIPRDHPKAHVRAAVPGTDEAIVAMMEVTLPRSRTVDLDSGRGLSVRYVGTPQFEPIEGTRLQRAVNSPQHVFLHNNYYYLCQEAAWYFSRSPGGPWSVALDVPDEIYRIPATDPAYAVTYVFPDAVRRSPEGKAHFTYNSGYLGEYSTGLTVVQGTGWYYSPWVWHDPAGYPVYWGYPHTYGWRMQQAGSYSQRFHYYGNYWGRQTITIESPPRGIHGPADSAYQDEHVARRGFDYSTLQEQRLGDSQPAYNAADDLYADADGDVYRRGAGGEWSTMAALERQYGTTGSKVGQAGTIEARQRQAYRQNEKDIERLERYYQSRQRSYNLYGTVYVRP